MSDIGERLKVRWLSKRLSLRPGTTRDQLEAFEARYTVRLPRDMREYFAAVDGTGRYSDLDKDLLLFWSLEEVKRLSEEWPDESCFKEPDSHFLFADHSIWCPAYAIRLSQDLTDRNPVLSIYSDMRRFEVSEVAQSFTEFVEEYLRHGVVG